LNNSMVDCSRRFRFVFVFLMTPSRVE